MIQIKHLRKEYANVTPLKDVNVTIHKGDVISIIGPSGTGKSTLIRCINLLEKPTSGEIWVEDQCITDGKCNINKVRQRMGMVFQSFNLFNHMTIIENIMAAPVDLLKKSKQEAYDEGMRLLRMVGLADKALNYPDELSGGQKQRVAIARCIFRNPKLLLLDEATSALDEATESAVNRYIYEQLPDTTILSVAHRFSTVLSAEKIVVVEQGRVSAMGKHEQLMKDNLLYRTLYAEYEDSVLHQESEVHHE